MPKKSNSQTLILGLVVILLVVLIALVATMKQPTLESQNKISTIPAEIKTPQQASSLQNDTSSILKEVQGSLTSIDQSLPEV